MVLPPANNELIVTPAEYARWKERVAAAADEAVRLGVKEEWEHAYQRLRQGGMLRPDAAEAALRDVTTVPAVAAQAILAG